MLFNLDKKTKIVCTIGPASDNPEKIMEMYKAGMNVIRINFSHGTHEDALKKIALARDLEKQGIYVPVALDTKGPEIRCGYMEKEIIDIKEGAKIRISMKECLGTAEKFSVTHAGLYDDVTVGNHILIDDGNLDLKIIGKDEKNRELLCKAMNTHPLKSQKGVNAPFARLSVPFISKKDESDIQFGCNNDMDMIFASFTRRPEDVMAIKKLCAKFGKKDMPVIVKIENPEAVEKFEQIIEIADGAMVARGDLGVEIPPQEVPVAQKKIVELCRKLGKPCIVATQMLDSMTTHPRPTRAEVTDVSYACSESADCIMLSSESAAGRYPVESVKMMAQIAHLQEELLPYEQLSKEAYETSVKGNSEAIANAVANTALLIGAKLIVSYTETGRSTRRISKARPCCPIISITNRRSTAMSGAMMWGVSSVLIQTPMPDFIEEMEVLALKIARDLKIKPGEPIIIAGGTPTGAGQANFMRIVNVNSIKDFD